MIEINNFKKSLEFVLKWEGGYVNDPTDSGGETKWGISKRSYPQLDIKNLTPEQAAEIYARDYWDACGCDGISFPLCTVVFDTGVNCGVSRAVRWGRDSTDSVQYIQRRVDHYVERVKKNPSQQKYMRGWMNRINDLKKFCEIESPS